MLIFIARSFSGCTQEPIWRFIPQTKNWHVPLGDTLLTLVQYCYNEQRAPFFLHLHHNEQTADSTLHDFISREGGSALGILNNRQRLVTFTQKGKRYLFDPNRMFTTAGIQKTLRLLSAHQPGAATAIRALADTLLSLIPPHLPIIAMHNNTDGAYSLLDYTGTGAYTGETELVFRNPEMDPDDFVLTTDRLLFTTLQQRGINAVLQRNERITDDGSLGYLMGTQQRFYVNIEAEHGHGREQANMLQAVVDHIYAK